MTEWSQNKLDRATVVWVTLTQMYGPRLTRDFGESVPEPWRSVIASLSDIQIQRGLRRLTASGSGSVPTLPQFSKACRDLGDDEGQTRPASTYLPSPDYDHFHRFGQKQFFKFIWTNDTTPEQLPKLIQRKNEIIDAARHDPEMQLGGDEVEQGKQLHEILFAAWRKVIAA
jgi:hypothetical protein